MCNLGVQPQIKLLPVQNFKINEQVSSAINNSRLKALELNLGTNSLNTGDSVKISSNNVQTGSIQVNFFQSPLHGKPVYIHLTPTYGTQEEITVKGRVTEDKEDSNNSTSNTSKIKNFAKNLGLLRQEELENVYVDIVFNGKTFKVQTDDEGYFNTKISGFGKAEAGYNKVQVRTSAGQKYASGVADGTVSIQPKNDKSFGIVTDIDDTIQKSYVTDKMKALKTLLFKNYQTQEEVTGTSELYQALDKRNDGKVDGDVYYVSGSPNQISSRIEGFLKFNRFPEGSLDLKRIGFAAGEDSPTKQIEYKVGKIRNLFNTYPEKKFILFGDSGEKDPEVYRQIAREFPGRVIATYINNVTGDIKTSPRYSGMLLTNNSTESARDLLQKGLINTSDFLTIPNVLR
jgi:phosphatidate phosphatase APP1